MKEHYIAPFGKLKGEKPPVLSPNEIMAWLQEKRIKDGLYKLVSLDNLPLVGRMEAQRDADDAYFRPVIERLERREMNETFRKLDETDKKLDEVKVKLVDTELAIQQARTEVAREVIEIAKREVKFAMRQELYKMPSSTQQDAVAHNLGSRLEASLKSKYLKGEKQKGFTDEELKDLRHNACDDTIG